MPSIKWCAVPATMFIATFFLSRLHKNFCTAYSSRHHFFGYKYFNSLASIMRGVNAYTNAVRGRQIKKIPAGKECEHIGAWEIVNWQAQRQKVSDANLKLIDCLSIIHQWLIDVQFHPSEMVCIRIYCS